MWLVIFWADDYRRTHEYWELYLLPDFRWATRRYHGGEGAGCFDVPDSAYENGEYDILTLTEVGAIIRDNPEYAVWVKYPPCSPRRNVFLREQDDTRAAWYSRKDVD